MTTRREDFLVSLCLADLPRDGDEIQLLRDLAGQIDARCRYWEILIVMEGGTQTDCTALLQEVPNLRILRTRGLPSYYRRRAIAATEAIGDIVLLTALDDIEGFDIPAMVLAAADGDRVIIGQRDRRQVLLDPLLAVLGQGSGFRVTAGDMLTAAYPRTILNRLLARKDRTLALRFPPRDSGIPVDYLPVRAGVPARRSSSGVLQRLGLVQRLLVNFAPLVLGVVSLLSVLVTISALAFAVYAVVVWISLETVQPGWLTTSLVLSLTAAFLGVAIFGLATGLMKLLDLLTPDPHDDVVDEQGRADLFTLVTRDLNVETTPGPDAPRAG